MDEEKLKRIQAFLETNGASVETISQARVKQLEKVDDAIQTRLLKIMQAKEIFKNAEINVSFISADTGISRKTFYNNDLLKLYVEYYSTNITEKNICLSEFNKLKAKNDELTKQINGFILRDIDTENIRHENLMLNKEIKNFQIRNEYLEKQCEELNKKFLDANRKLMMAKNKALIFPKHKY